MRETVETIKEKVHQRAWDQASIEDRKIKLRRYRRGESLGSDTPAIVKIRDRQTRARRKVCLLFLMIGFVIITA